VTKRSRGASAQGEGGLTIFVDGSRLNSGAAGFAYTVVWKVGDQWADIRVHAGCNQEAYDTECIALARALEVAASRRTAPEVVTIFPDSQAAIGRMASNELGPGQKYAILAREWIAKLKAKKPEVQVEIRWCPGHSGTAGNERADQLARQAAEDPEAPGAEWLGHGDRYGKQRMPLPITGIKREVTEKKWEEARAWCSGRVNKKKYGMPSSRPNRMLDRSRFHQIRTGALPYGPILAVDEECGQSEMRVVPIQDTDPRAPAQALQAMETAAEDPVGGGTKGDRKRERPLHDPGPVRRRAMRRRDPGLFAHHEGGEQGGPKSGGDAGNRRGHRRGGRGRGTGRREGRRMKGIRGGGGFHWSGLSFSLSLYCHCHSFSAFSALSLLSFSFSWEQPGGSRGSCHGPPGGLREQERTVYNHHHHHHLNSVEYGD